MSDDNEAMVDGDEQPAPVQHLDKVHMGVSVDLKKELFKMIRAQGLKPEDLNAVIKLRRSEQFRQIILEHFRARDIGYAEGMRDGLRARWPAPLWCLFGVSLPFLAYFLVKLFYFGRAVWAAGF